MVYHVLALLVPICWAFASILSTNAVRKYGTLNFNLIRNTVALVLLIPTTVIFGDLSLLTEDNVIGLVLSGVIGIYLGDLLLFQGVAILGIRRAGVLFSTHVVMTVVLGWLILNEVVSARAMTGIGLVIAGVIIAIAFRRGQKSTHPWEDLPTSIIPGVVISLSAAFCQAVGLLITRSYVVDEIDGLTALLPRVVAAASCLLITRVCISRRACIRDTFAGMTIKDATLIILSGLLAMLVGNALLLIALTGILAGVAATYVSLVPVVQLPMIAIITRQMPKKLAWFGALMAFLGAMLLFSTA